MNNDNYNLVSGRSTVRSEEQIFGGVRCRWPKRKETVNDVNGEIGDEWMIGMYHVNRGNFVATNVK